jgi:hypothetical protein
VISVPRRRSRSAARTTSITRSPTTTMRGRCAAGRRGGRPTGRGRGSGGVAMGRGYAARRGMGRCPMSATRASVRMNHVRSRSRGGRSRERDEPPAAIGSPGERDDERPIGRPPRRSARANRAGTSGRGRAESRWPRGGIGETGVEPRVGGRTARGDWRWPRGHGRAAVRWSLAAGPAAPCAPPRGRAGPAPCPAHRRQR